VKKQTRNLELAAKKHGLTKDKEWFENDLKDLIQNGSVNFYPESALHQILTSFCIIQIF